MAGSWRRLHNEELHYLHASPNIVRVIEHRRMRWMGHEVHMGKMRNTYKILVGKSEEKIPLGRSSRRWDDNIRLDLKEIGWNGMLWTEFIWFGTGTNGGLS
jgi:hypothetical protein